MGHRRCKVARDRCHAVPQCLHLLDPLWSNESSSLREGLEPALQRKGHAFQQTSVNHIGEWVPIQNSMKIRREPQSACDLSQASEEDSGARHLRVRGEILRVARIANDCVGRDPSQQKRRRRQTRRADDDVGLGGESLDVVLEEISRDLHLNSIALQLGSKPAKSLQVARAEQHALHERRQTTGAAGAHIPGCSNDKQGRSAKVLAFQRAHLLDALNDESNGQSIARGEDGIVSFRKLIEIALDQNGAESAETHDLRSCLDRAGGRPSNPGNVLVHVGGFQTVGRNKGIDVEAASGCSDSLFIIEDRPDLDMTDCSGRNPGKDVFDLIVRQRRTLRSAQDSEYVRSRSPTLLMPDQGEIDIHNPRPC